MSLNHFPPPAISRFVPVPTTGALAAAFALIMKGFCDAIGVRAGHGLVPAPLALLVLRRVQHLALRIERLAARFRAGTLRPPRPRLHPHPHPRPAAPPPPPPPPPRLSRRFGWLGQMVPEARVHASQLEHWLAEPEWAEILQAAPQAARLLRPLFHMMGFRPDPALLPPLPRRPRKPRPPPAQPAQPARPARPARPAPPEGDATAARAAPAPADEDDEEEWYHRSIETDDGLADPRRPWWLPPKGRRGD